MSCLKDDPMVIDDDFDDKKVIVKKEFIVVQPRPLDYIPSYPPEKVILPSITDYNRLYVLYGQQCCPDSAFANLDEKKDQLNDALKILTFDQKSKLIDCQIMYLIRLKVDVRDYYYHIGVTKKFIERYYQIDQEYNSKGKLLILCLIPIKSHEDENELRKKYLKKYVVKSIAIKGTDKRKLYQIHSDVFINFVKFYQTKNYQPIYYDPNYSIIKTTEQQNEFLMKPKNTVEKYREKIYDTKTNIYPFLP